MKLRKSLFPILILFVAVNLMGFLAPGPLGSLDVEVDVLLVGNLLVCSLTLFSFWMLNKGLQASSTHAFMSSVYGSFILKLVIAALVVVVYAKIKGAAINNSGIFACLLLYLFYTFLEIKGLLLLIKKD
jgi:hypothetical protein